MAATHGQLVKVAGMETAYLVVLAAALLAVGVVACWLLVKLVASR